MSAKGQWANEDDRTEITDSQIVWNDGKTEPVTLAEDGSLTLAQDTGKSKTAMLKDNGKELVWSDGDVWTRIDEVVCV